MDFLEPIDYRRPGFGEYYDELPLWSARFGITLLEHVGLKPGMTILDVGAGTGFVSIELAQRCGVNSIVIAVDPWKAAMDRLDRKLEFMGIQNVRTIVQDAATLDLPDESVDLIVSNLGINNFENADEVILTCFRVAKPGAEIALTTNLVGHMNEFYEAYRSVLVEQGNQSRLELLDRHVQQRSSVESICTRLTQAGFEFSGAVTSSFRERFVDGSAMLRHHFIRLAFVQGWKAIAPEGCVEATFEAIERLLNSISSQKGELSMTIPTACIRARKPTVSRPVE